MKIGRFSIPFALSGTLIALIVIQLALVSTFAARYLYQRWTCPLAWTRAVGAEPEASAHGRYLSLQLTVDGCQSTLPSAKLATFPRDVNGAVKPGPFVLRSQSSQPAYFNAYLKVVNNKLVAVRVEGQEDSTAGEGITAMPGTSCDQMSLNAPVDFLLAKHAHSPLPLKPGQELWVEVTVPPKGPPQPVQVALKQDGVWKPLGFQ
jgi:hypothetical protein